MKRVFPLAFAILSMTFIFGGYGNDIPSPIGWVSDFADVIEAGDEERIAHIATTVKKITGAEVAIAAVASIDDYAIIDEFSLSIIAVQNSG